MGKARRLLALLLALALLLPCFCAALAEGEEQKVPDAKAVYEHDGVTYYQVQRDDDKAGLESPEHFYLDLMKNDRKDKGESKTSELGDYSTADLWALAGWSCQIGNTTDFDKASNKDTLTSLLREAVQTHSLVEKTDPYGEIYKGCCTDVVYAGSMNAAGKELCDDLQEKLSPSIYVPPLYQYSQYPDSAIGSKQQPVIGIAFHAENTSAYSGVFVYLTDFKVVALLPDAQDKDGSPYVQSIVDQSEPSKQSYASDVMNLTLEPVTASQAITNSWSTTVGSTVSHSSSYSFSEGISVGWSYKFVVAKISATVSFTATQAFSDGWSSSKTQTQSDSISRSVSVPLPPYTRALLEQEDGKTTYATKYNCPIGLRFTVRVIGYNGIYGGGTEGGATHYYQFGPDARADLYKRAILNADLDAEIDAGFSYAIHWPQVAKVKAPNVDFDAYDYIRTAAKFVPFGPTDASFTEELTTISTTVKGIVPVEPLSVIKLQAPNVSFVSDQPVSYGNFNYLHADMKVGDSSYTSLLNLSGQNVDGAAYYGFNPRLGHWEVTDAQGNPLTGDDAPVRTEKQDSGTTKYIAQKPGTCFLKYFIDEHSYLRDATSPDKGYTTNDELIMTAALEITVTEDAVKPAHTIAVTGSYAGEVGKDAEKLEENGLAVSICGADGKEISEAYTWEARELPARGISLNADGTVQFTKPGTFHLRAVCDAHNIASDWVEITATEARPTHTVVVIGSYAGEVRRAAEKLEDNGLAVSIRDESGKEIDEAYTWEAQELPAKGISLGEDGAVRFTKPGAFHVRAVCKAHNIASDWLDITAAEKGLARIITPPTARDGLYDGKEQALLVPGEVDGGTMVYCLDADTSDAAFTEVGRVFSADIPTASQAGTYKIWYKALGDANHIDSQVSYLIVTVLKSPVQPVKPDSDALVYNGKAQALVEAGNVAGGTLQYFVGDKAPDRDGDWSADIPTGTNAGDYTVWYRVKGDKNHNDSEPASLSVTIEKKPLLVTPNDAAKTYGEADPVLTWTADGLVGRDSLIGKLKRAKGENVGTYAIRQGSLSHSDNYALTFNEGLFTITPKSVTVKAQDATAVYGEADPTLKYTVTGLVGRDRLTGRLARKDGVDVGKYPITLGTLAASGNYTLKFEGAVFTITKRPVTVKAQVASKRYGDADPELEYTVKGLLDPEQIGGKLVRKAGEEVGAYAIGKGSLVVGRNYALTFNGADFTIKPRIVTVTAKDVSKVVGSADPDLTYSVKGLINGDRLKGRLSREAGEAPGSYAITQGTIKASKNYAIRFNGARLTVTARAKLPVVSDFTLLAKMTSERDSTIFFSWSGVKGAVGYDVFFKVCDGDQDYTLYKSVMGKNCRIKALKKGRAYKGYVRAWTNKNGRKAYIGKASPVVHCIAGGYNKTETNTKSVKLNKTRLTLVKGKTSVLNASTKGARSDRKLLAHTREIRFYSSNANVAKVNRSGKVTAVEGGVCTIYAVSNDGVHASARIKVIATPQKVSFARASYTVKLGKTLKLAKQVKLSPAGVKSRLGWTSSDPTVATVSAKGVVKGVRKGSATITVVAENGKKAKVTVNVK